MNLGQALYLAVERDSHPPLDLLHRLPAGVTGVRAGDNRLYVSVTLGEYEHAYTELRIEVVPTFGGGYECRWYHTGGDWPSEVEQELLEEDFYPELTQALSTPLPQSYLTNLSNPIHME